MKAWQNLVKAAMEKRAALSLAVRQFFCEHDLVTRVAGRVSVRVADKEVGTVKITWLKCKKCSRDYIFASDRVNTDKAAPDGVKPQAVYHAERGEVDIHFSAN